MYKLYLIYTYVYISMYGGSPLCVERHFRLEIPNNNTIGNVLCAVRHTQRASNSPYSVTFLYNIKYMNKYRGKNRRRTLWEQ